jgi:hypothetical protein
VSWTDYLENKMLDHILSATTYTPPATLYVGLFSVAPGEATSGTELSGGSYARVAVTNNSTNFPAASGGSKTNGAAFTFPTATADWSAAVAAGLFDASSGGNLLMKATGSNFNSGNSKTVQNGDTAEFAASTMTFTLD